MTTTFLGLPLQRRRQTLLWTALLFAYYLLTMSRGLSMYDSPELAMVAGQLGLGHPTGQPVHTLLGWVTARLGSIVGLHEVITLNALSALAGALCLIPAASLADTILADDRGLPTVQTPVVLPAIAAMGIHTALWEPATRIEVYSLACLFSLWAIAKLAHALTAGSPRRSDFFVVGLCTGLAAATHPHFGFATALALAPRILIALGRKEVRLPSLGAAVAGGLAGLLPYLYVPLIARRDDVVIWGRPTDMTSLGRYFTGAEFAHNREITLASWGEHLWTWVRWANDSGVLVLIAAGFVGYWLFCKRRVLGRLPYNVLVVYFVALVTSNTRFAPDVLDYLEYLGIVSWLAATGTALLLAHLWSLRTPGPIIAILLAMFILIPDRSSFFRTRRLDHVTDDIATEALQRAPKDAILLVEHDHWIAPLWYLQERQGMRRDVVLVAYGLTGSSWYWEYLYRRHPTLALIPLRAPGGKVARVQRFLTENKGRPLQVERVVLAQQLGLPACPSDWLLDVRSRCPEAQSIPSLAWYTRDALAELGDGSRGTDGLLALIAFERGYDLWSMGFPRAAVQTLLAGVPGDPVLLESLARIPERADPTAVPAPEYDPRVALGHPARNLAFAATIARSSGIQDLAEHFEALSVQYGPVTPKIAAR